MVYQIIYLTFILASPTYAGIGYPRQWLVSWKSPLGDVSDLNTGCSYNVSNVELAQVNSSPFSIPQYYSLRVVSFLVILGTS